MTRSATRTLGLLLAAGALAAASCSSSSSNNTGGNGGSAGKGGSGGGTAGSGGGTAGTPGTGGAAGVGGGTAGTGGGAAGTGGGAVGTDGGAAGSGGTGGTAVVQPVAAPIDATAHPPGPAATGAVFFSGTDGNISKIVSTDPSPGYFTGFVLNSPGSTAAFSVDLLPAASTVDAAVPDGGLPVDRGGLPDGVVYAEHYATTFVTKQPAVAFEFNFRANKTAAGGDASTGTSDAWQYVDVSNYLGIVFWARSSIPGDASLSVIDATNIGENEAFAGACPAAPAGTDPRAMCSGIHSATVSFTTTWKQFKIPFASLQQPVDPTAYTGDLDLKRVGRVDFFHIPGDSDKSFDLYITGIKLATAQDLQ